LPGGVSTFYAGRDLDTFTGLYNNRARWYDPASGRFISEDPLQFAAGDTNLYRYCANSPMNFTDPTGLWFESVWDATSLGFGLWSFRNDVEEGNVGWAIVDAVGIAADTVALVLPFVPGGVGAGIKALRAGDVGVDAVRAMRGGEVAVGLYRTSQVVQAGDVAANAWQSYDAYQHGDYLQAGLSGFHVGIRGVQTTLNVRSWARGRAIAESAPTRVSAPKGGLPAGIRYEGTLHRAVPAKYADGAWDIHAGNIAANHRYSGSGRGALYTGTSKDAVLGELRHYGVDPDSVAWLSRNVSVDNVLDLTNPAVRKQLGISLEQITTNDYLYTQALGDFARERYRALLVPSARQPGTSNLVILR